MEDVSDDFVGFVEDNMKGPGVEFVEVRGFQKKSKSAGFRVKYNQPKGRTTSVKIDMSMRQNLITDHSVRSILHSYEDLGAFSVPVMSIKENVAEKIVALAYTRHPRHLHDVWFLHRRGVGIDAGMVRAKTASTHDEDFDLGKLVERLPEKAAHWTEDMRRLVPGDPPPFGQVSEYVRATVSEAMG